MRRAWVLTAMAGFGLVALGLSWTTFSGARPAAKEEKESRAANLPIGQVVLYSSGVDFFQREGAVEGNARVDLSFPVSDINDLLKSMVLRDLDGGHVAAVSYDSNAPVERTLRSFAVDLTRNPSLAELLNQARGEKVEVALAQGGAAANLTGTIVGVERQKQAVVKEAVEHSVLNLWCSDGLRTVKLAEAQRIRFLNPTMEKELKGALETLALSHDTQKKAVSIRFSGEGKRQVRVGYVVENPIWKTSYRLVLPATKKAEAPYLQGWAVVENPTDEDWKDVRMALVSGRPISFKMDLYTPLYVPRPTVVPELFASLQPVAYSGSTEDEGRRMARLRSLSDRDEDKKAGADKAPQRFRAGQGGFGAMPRGETATPAVNRFYAERTGRELRERLELGQSVSSAASAARLGDFFQYAVDRPVSLARQKSALLPIVGKDVQATRVSIYNERTQAKFPLLGLRFKNTSGLHLMQGPITVFEGSRYAGDARILDLQPNEERLLSYAVDLGTEVAPAPVEGSGRITLIKAVKGIIHTTTKQRQGRTYTVKNRNDSERTVLVEHPVTHLFSLVDSPKPAETAADVHRFELKVPSGASKALTVSEERLFGQQWSLASSGDEQVRHFISQSVISASVKKGLQRALELRHAVSKTQREIAELQRQLNTITQDQIRLRANLREMPSTAKAYKRYLEKFDQQETQIETYQSDVKKLQATEHAQQKELEDFLASFTAE